MMATKKAEEMSFNMVRVGSVLLRTIKPLVKKSATIAIPNNPSSEAIRRSILDASWAFMSLITSYVVPLKIEYSFVATGCVANPLPNKGFRFKFSQVMTA